MRSSTITSRSPGLLDRPRFRSVGRVTLAVFVVAVVAAAATAPLASAQTRPWPVKRLGDDDRRGDGNVRVVELLLRAHGYGIAADGVFTRQTVRAVRRFQARHDLETDGVVGGRTWARLIVSIRFGSRGDAVRAAQLRLRQNAEYAGSIDGVFGRQTRAAVRSFQRNVGISVDGVIGRQTWRALVTWGNND